MNIPMSRRSFLETGAGMTAAALAVPGQPAPPAPACTLETTTFELVVGQDATCLALRDKRTGRDHALPERPKLARARVGGRDALPVSARFDAGRLHLDFNVGGLRVVLTSKTHRRSLILEVESVEGGPVEELGFVDFGLTLAGTQDEPFAACLIARNLKTNVPELPRAVGRLRALAYPELGLVGASVALVAAPRDEFRTALQEAVEDAPELPHSRLGGPWALDAPVNRGSYLFNFDGITSANVDAWIDLARRLGMTQIDFHGGQSFRFGDCRPNPSLYPNGRADLKAVIDRLHAAGIAAGLHTYAFFLARDTPWVAPVPDARLATARTLTLATDLDAAATTLPVVESTAGVSATTGFFVRNSATLRVGEELIVFGGVSDKAPFAFTQCQRGAHGTKASAHPHGAKVGHLKECFGLFVPDPDTTLLAEVAALTADTYNACGFDMIYLDALDGSDVLDPHRHGEFAWHYGSRFAFEIAQRLRKPAVFEMSTFSHHLWCIRSRYVAWDHPNRSYKRFVDLHCVANEESRRMFLPGELGWWALKDWTGAQTEPTFADDIEYLLAKGLATDTGFALMGIDPKSAAAKPALPRMAELIRRWETLRLSGRVPAALEDRLREPGAEFTLEGDVGSNWTLRPVEYAPHRVEASDERTRSWQVVNRHGPQPLALRIEALLAAGPHDAPGNPVLADFHDPADFPLRAAQEGVAARWEPSRDRVKAGPVSGRFTLTSRLADRKGAWAKFEKTFNPPLDLSRHKGLGLWVYGDGSGALLNLQLRSPTHLVSGIAERYVALDFEGWRHVELVEHEGERWSHYRWPYGDAYSIYREVLQDQQVASLGVWFNDLPPNRTVVCHLESVRAVPLVAATLVNPVVSVGESTLRFPRTLNSGQYLEFAPPGPARLYGPDGGLLGDVRPEGTTPVLPHGASTVGLRTDSPVRARVTVLTRGEPLRA
jgi:hypothetical protein